MLALEVAAHVVADALHFVLRRGEDENFVLTERLEILADRAVLAATTAALASKRTPDRP